MDKQLERLVDDATVAVRSKPFSTTEYEKVKEFIETNSMQKPNSMWKIKLEYEPFSEGDIEEWETAIEQQFKPGTVAKHKLSMYETIARKYPTVHHIDKSFDKIHHKQYEIQYAYERCKHDFVHGQIIFTQLVSSLIQTKEKDWNSIRELYEARLQIPHRQIQETYEAFSTFVSAHFAEEYTTIMRNASKLLRATEKSQRYYEQLEMAVSSDPDLPEPWLNYMKQLFHYSDKKSPHPAFLLVFYRSLFAGSRWKIGDPFWFDLWLTVLLFLKETPNTTSEADNISRLMVINYPQSPEAYIEAAWYLSSKQKVRGLRERAIAVGFLDKTKEEHYTLAKDLITVENAFGTLCYLSADYVSDLKVACETFNYREDLVRLCVTTLECSYEKSAKDARKLILDSFLGKDRYCAQKYITVFDIHERRGFEDEVYALIDIIEKNLRRFDDPDLVYSRIEWYLRVNATEKSRFLVHQRLQNLSKVLTEIKNERSSKKVQVEEQKPQELERASRLRPRADEDNTSLDLPDNKRVKTQPTEGVQEPVRSREQFRVKLYPLALNASVDDITKFLKGYAEPLSITISNSSHKLDDQFAVIELASEQDVLSCLTRQYKPLLGVTVNITRIFGTTVWATNYPLGYDSDDIHKMIIDAAGKTPIAIRLPAQRDNKERRFFYADFADEESANLVRDKLSGLVLDGHEIQAEISNPTLRKPREMAPASQQIYLHNLNFKKTTEDSLRQCFLKWGEISGVHLPLSDVNKEKGYLNNGYAFITFSNDASAAEAQAQEKAKIDDRVVDISAVKPKRSPEKRVPSFDDQKTISIKNINDTVTEAQLKKFIEDKIGLVSHVSLKPSKKMALVEFETVKDAGKAGFALEGVLYEDRILNVGQKKDFFQEDKILKVPSMVSPMLMRRRRK